MKQSFLRTPSRSRVIADPLESQRTTPSIRPLQPLQQPPTLQLNQSISNGTTNPKNLQAPLISTEFLKRSVFDKLEDNLIAPRIYKSYNNLAPPAQQTTALTERVTSIGDSEKLKLQPMRSRVQSFGKKKAAQSLERIQKSSITINEPAVETEAEKEAKAVEEKRMRYTKLMMFIPRNLESLSVANQHKPSFISFTDIAKTSRTTNPGMIDDLIIKSATLKRSESKDSKVETADQLDIVKNILKFNKQQKAQYNEQVSEEAARKITPLKGLAKHRKSKTKTPVRIVPSRRLHEPLYDMMEDKTETMSVRTGSPDKPDPTESSQREMTQVSLLKAMSTGQRASSPEDFAIFSMGSHNYKFFWYALNKEKGLWRPDAREGHTFTAVGRQVILYGGLGNRLLDKIEVYDSDSDTWTQPEVKGEVPRVGRHSHTACEYKGHVVFFGGELKFNPTLGLRECLNDLHLFSPDKNEWKYIKAIGKIDPRRNHAATVFDKFMYVHGGISTEGTFMKDVWAFNFKATQWTQLFPTGGREGGLAYHTICACFNEKNSREKYKVTEEGIYVFGGRDEDGRILNTLKILSISGKNCEWKYPAIKGTAPAARYNHVMLWYKPLQLLLIHGGRNEYIEEGVCMNDIKILHLESMTWGSSAAVGYVPKIGRSNHGGVLLRSRLIIFGGVTFYEYANPDLRQIEINQLTTRRLMKEFAEPEEKIEVSGSPKTRRYLETQEETEEEVPKEVKEPDFVSWQPLPLKQQFPIEESLVRFRQAIKQTVFLNIAKKLGKNSK